MTGQVPDIVGLLLPDPEKLVHGAFQVLPPYGKDGKLFPQVVAVDDAEQLHGVGGGAVLPPGTDLQPGIPDPFGENILTVLDKQFIGAAHGGSSLV